MSSFSTFTQPVVRNIESTDLHDQKGFTIVIKDVGNSLLKYTSGNEIGNNENDAAAVVSRALPWVACGSRKRRKKVNRELEQTLESR